MLYRFIISLINPFLLLIFGIGIVLLCARKRLGRRMNQTIWILYSLFLLWSHPLVAYLAVGSLEWSYPPVSPAQHAKTDAIVVLAGGIWEPDTYYKDGRLKDESIRRCIDAAELYRQHPDALVFASGGTVSPRPGPHEAELMSRLLRHLGVPDNKLILETSSRTTYESAVEMSTMLRKHECRHIVLVTTAYHLSRSVACYRKLGIEVVPVGTHYLAVDYGLSAHNLLPSASSIKRNQAALHEWMGLIWYRIRGRI